MGSDPATLECVVNVSEGRDESVLREIAASCADVLLDLHRDPWHHRSVMTLGGPAPAVEAAARALAASAVALLDLGPHRGAHPRFGVIDVVPFVPLGAPAGRVPADLHAAVRARDRFAAWAGRELSLPCFLYGPLPGGSARSLPDIRRRAFVTMWPDSGPRHPHPTAGAAAVGARGLLVAYNLWVDGAGVDVARGVARAIRGERVRALGFDLDGAAQVSCNLVDPDDVGPAQVFDQVAAMLRAAGARIERAELVGLIPASVLARTPRHRWPELDIGPDLTIEARLGDPSLRTR